MVARDGKGSGRVGSEAHGCCFESFRKGIIPCVAPSAVVVDHWGFDSAGVLEGSADCIGDLLMQPPMMRPIANTYVEMVSQHSPIFMHVQLTIAASEKSGSETSALLVSIQETAVGVSRTIIPTQTPCYPNLGCPPGDYCRQCKTACYNTRLHKLIANGRWVNIVRRYSWRSRRCHCANVLSLSKLILEYR